MSSAKVQYGDENARQMFRPGTKARTDLGKTLGWMAKLAERLGEEPSSLTFRVSSTLQKPAVIEEPNPFEEGE